MSNKIRTTIIMDARLVEQARQIAAAKGSNLSRYINSLVEKDIHGDMLIDEPSATLGTLRAGVKKLYKTRNELYEKGK